MLQSSVARWSDELERGTRLGKLLGGAPHVKSVATADVRGSSSRAASGWHDLGPHAASCEVRIGGESIDVRAAGDAVRRIAQQLLGGPPELAATRPLGIVEHSIWALVVASALEDLAIAADVVPHIGARPPPQDAVGIAVAIDAGGLALPVIVHVPQTVEVWPAPVRPAPSWTERVMIDLPIVLGRCAIASATLGRLAMRDVITLEPPHGFTLCGAELVVLGGAIGLQVAPHAVVAEVATEYVRRDMSLPDDAHVELTVSLGTTQLSLRQVFELSVGQIVQLGRPLAGPFEVRAAGKTLGRGELVDVDGELGVRIVSLGDL